MLEAKKGAWGGGRMMSGGEGGEPSRCHKPIYLCNDTEETDYIS